MCGGRGSIPKLQWKLTGKLPVKWKYENEPHFTLKPLFLYKCETLNLSLTLLLVFSTHSHYSRCPRVRNLLIFSVVSEWKWKEFWFFHKVKFTKLANALLWAFQSILVTSLPLSLESSLFQKFYSNSVGKMTLKWVFLRSLSQNPFLSSKFGQVYLLS